MTRADHGPAHPSGVRPGEAAPRGWASVYALAFFLLLLAAGALAMAVRGLFQSRGFFWLSIGLSATAIVCSLASLMLRRRR